MKWMVVVRDETLGNRPIALYHYPWKWMADWRAFWLGFPSSHKAKRLMVEVVRPWQP